jgi:hypothetical protein
LACFISTLNSSFPDYDFSCVTADQFERKESFQQVYLAVDDEVMRSIEMTKPGFRTVCAIAHLLTCFD